MPLKQGKSVIPALPMEATGIDPQVDQRWLKPSAVSNATTVTGQSGVSLPAGPEGLRATAPTEGRSKETWRHMPEAVQTDRSL